MNKVDGRAAAARVLTADEAVRIALRAYYGASRCLDVLLELGDERRAEAPAGAPLNVGPLDGAWFVGEWMLEISRSLRDGIKTEPYYTKIMERWGSEDDDFSALKTNSLRPLDNPAHNQSGRESDNEQKA